MAVETTRLEWEAMPWESIPSESGLSLSSFTTCSPSVPHSLYNTPIVSESRLIQLAINALQGTESALSTIEKLCTTFDCDPADRTFLRIPSIWKRTSSTLALGRILKSIGCSGCLVFLLRKFVDHFENLHFNASLRCNNFTSIVPQEGHNDSEPKAENHNPQSLVNHAFSVALRKLLEGCIAAVDTLYASVNLRRSSEAFDTSPCSSFRVGCLARSDYSEVTLLEVYLHSKELRTEIDVIGNICQMRDISFCFSELCLEDLLSKAKSGFLNFPRGGDLLTYLYSRLKVADPAHNALLKFLFLRSCEPYCEFIRLWIYKAEICDPYKEFVVEYSRKLPQSSDGEDGSSSCISLAAVKERDGVSIPCFLKDICNPIFRAGQQLQVLMKLFELSGHITNESVTYGDILPCWSVFSSDHSSDASPLSFDRESVEALSHARSIYYRRMMAKMDIILEDLRTRFQQVVTHGTVPDFIGYLGGSQEVSILSRNDDKRISPKIDNRDAELIVDTSDFDASSTSDEELLVIEDQLASSEYSSSDGSEEQNESVQFHQFSSGYEQKVLSPLELLSMSRNEASFRVACTNDTFNSGEGDTSKFIEIINADDISSRPCLGETNLIGNFSSHVSGNPDLSWFSESQCKSNVYDKSFLFSGLVQNPFSIAKMVRHDATSLPSETGLKLRGSNIPVLSESSTFLCKTSPIELSSTNESNNNDPTRTGPSSSFLNLPNLSSKCHSNPLSMNPVLFKSELLRKREKRLCADQIDHAPSFEFSSVKDPCKIQEESLLPSLKHHFRAETTRQKDHTACAAIGSTKFHKDDRDDDHETLLEKDEFSHVNLSLLSEKNMKEDSNMENVCGGSSWESMLNCLGNTVENSARARLKSLAAAFEMPLDFVIEKCLLQEILHQYWYISKLTIKVLEDGFNLREHFSALRRYHFMELADWADLFIVSLWNRVFAFSQKLEAMEVDRTVSEIQGLLAMSLQKSSCEKDDCKDRLFVYIKETENNMMPSLIPKIEIDSFNFLGLGYKVDWPINIVLTPGALEIYVQIFSFLLRVKLAIFSLTDTWCLMKDLLKFNRQSLYANARKLEIQGPRSEMQHLNTLTTVRQQVNHFVTTLQQYVQSQLSHVSSCRYTDSLNSKVKDMMDLQSVHMSYLIDSLHICFLSDEMKAVASIIQNIMQCALDLRSCLVVSKGGSQIRGGFPDKVSWIDISQVLAVKNAFKKNITDLHLCFLKAPKQREFGLAHFWGFLNYNEYYSYFTENRNYNGFPV